MQRREAVRHPVVDEPTSMEARASGWIALTLQSGVIASAVLILFGLLLVAVHGGGTTVPSLDEALGRTDSVAPVHLRALWHDVTHLHGLAFIQAGLLVLILTPTLRVAITVVVFALERERILAALAVIVLLILVAGLVGIGAE
jgi:uncharacterized membrane protein